MRPLTLFVLVEFVLLLVLAVAWFQEPPTRIEPTEPGIDPPTSGVAATTTASTVMATPSGSVAAPERNAATLPSAQVAANDPVGIVVHGSVLDDAGAPVADANVHLRRDDAYRIGESASPGAWAIAGAQPGTWTLHCRTDGFAPIEQTVELDARAFQRHDLVLQRAHIVRVKMLGNDGKSIVPELQKANWFGLPYVIATEAPLAGDLPPTFQSRLIRFGIGEWSPYEEGGRNAQPKLVEQGFCGELRLHRAPPAHVSLLLRTTVLQSQRVAPGQDELVFTLETNDVLSRMGSVRLRLLDGSGAPLANVHVNCSTAQGGGSGAKSDAEGRVAIDRALPGIGNLEVWPGKDREGLTRFVRVPSGGVVDLGDIVLGSAEKISGIVVGADGKPCAGATLHWTDLDGRTFPQPLVDNRTSSSDADGKFGLFGTGRHRYVVFARTSDGGFGYATVDARNGAPTSLTIATSKPTTVALRVAPDPTVGYTVTVLAADRTPVAVATLGTEYRPKTLAVPPGNYTVEIHDLSTDRLLRTFPLLVGDASLAIEVP